MTNAASSPARAAETELVSGSSGGPVSSSSADSFWSLTGAQLTTVPLTLGASRASPA